MLQPFQVLTDLSQHTLDTCIVLNYATVSKFDMLQYSVLKHPVQFCLIASLIACVHGKVHSLSKSSRGVQPISNRTIVLTTNSIKICIINYLCEAPFDMDY